MTGATFTALVLEQSEEHLAFPFAVPTFSISFVDYSPSFCGTSTKGALKSNTWNKELNSEAAMTL